MWFIIPIAGPIYKEKALPYNVLLVECVCKHSLEPFPEVSSTVFNDFWRWGLITQEWSQTHISPLPHQHHLDDDDLPRNYNAIHLEEFEQVLCFFSIPELFLGSQGVIWYQKRVTATTWSKMRDKHRLFSFVFLGKVATTSPRSLSPRQAVKQAHLCSLAPASFSWPRCYDSSQPPPPPFPVPHPRDTS